MISNEHYIGIIDKYIEDVFLSRGEFSTELVDSMKYSLSSGGKRIRPLFCMFSYLIYSQDLDTILPYACAVELIHTYSLIHDDLPAMDDDDYRRGKPTNHKVFGEAMAILAGDSLLNLSAELISQEILTYESFEDAKRGMKALNYIFNCSGSMGMIGGQVEDIKEGEKSLKELEKMYSLKTSALLKASIISGAIIGGANEDDIKVLEDFANKLGIFYQIQDDYLDISEDENIEKETMIKYLDKDNIDIFLSNMVKDLNNLLNSINGNTKYIKELTNFLVSRSY